MEMLSDPKIFTLSPCSFFFLDSGNNAVVHSLDFFHKDLFLNVTLGVG